MGKASRTKGHGWERLVARDLTEATGARHARVLIETRDGNSGDVEGDESSFLYQAKCGKRPDIYGAVREAVEAADRAGKMGVAVIHRTGRGGEKLVLLRWTDWLKLVRAEGGT